MFDRIYEWTIIISIKQSKAFERMFPTGHEHYPRTQPMGCPGGPTWEIRLALLLTAFSIYPNPPSPFLDTKRSYNAISSCLCLFSFGRIIKYSHAGPTHLTLRSLRLIATAHPSSRGPRSPARARTCRCATRVRAVPWTRGGRPSDRLHQLEDGTASA